MCVIAVSLRGVKFSAEDLKKMWDANSHGAGVAWLNGSKVKVRKGFMKFDKFIEFYEEEVPEGVMHAIHFRLRSAGEVVSQLTHPFRIDAIDRQELEYEANGVLFHNGTVADWRSLFVSVLGLLRKKDISKILSVEHLSDSYVMSLLVYRRGHQVLKFFADTSKWLVFQPEPVFYGRWERDDKKGFAFSNMSWKYVVNVYGVRYSDAWKGSCGYDIGRSGRE